MPHNYNHARIAGDSALCFEPSMTALDFGKCLITITMRGLQGDHAPNCAPVPSFWASVPFFFACWGASSHVGISEVVQVES